MLGGKKDTFYLQLIAFQNEITTERMKNKETSLKEVLRLHRSLETHREKELLCVLVFGTSESAS
jgi:hypothetical protein